jgi:hypothetical protein
MRELGVRWEKLQGEGLFTETKMIGQLKNWTSFASAWTKGKN